MAALGGALSVAMSITSRFGPRPRRERLTGDSMRRPGAATNRFWRPARYAIGLMKPGAVLPGRSRVRADGQMVVHVLNSWCVRRGRERGGPVVRGADRAGQRHVAVVDVDHD